MKARKGGLLKRGKTWHAYWYVGDKRFAKTTGQTKREDAEKVLAEFVAPFLVSSEVRTLEVVKARIEGAKGELVRYDELQNPPLTVGEAWTAFKASTNRPDSGESTLEQYEIQWGRFWAWMKEHHPEIKAMRDVSKEIASEYAANLQGEGKSANTFNKYMNVLTLVFRVLKDKAKIVENHWENIQRKRLTGTGRRELTIEELRGVCDKADGELRLLLALGIYTGLRLKDCCLLKWGEVDMVQCLIRRVPSKMARRNNTPVIIPIHNTLAAMLAEIPAARRKGFVLPDTAAAYLKRSDTVTDRIQRHFVACGLDLYQTGTGVVTKIGDDGKKERVKTGKRAVLEVGFHSLRHSFVSLCRAGNVPLSVVESIVGHSNPAMTRHYTHTGINAAQSAIAGLPTLDGKALPAPDPVQDILRLVEALTEPQRLNLIEMLSKRK
jgi:integrase